MRVRVRPGESAVRAAQRNFGEAKRLRAQADGLRKGIADLEARLAALEARPAGAPAGAPRVRVREARKREWFEAFHWFRTSGGRLVLAGKDARQNELLVARHLEAGDLFFHADIAGGAATVLKDGQAAGEQERREAAQWAACFSKAWKLGYASLDVYAVPAGQVSKAAPAGEYLPKGSFMILGRREWFRGMPLALALAKGPDGRLAVLPAGHHDRPSEAVAAVPGAGEKRGSAEAIKGRLGLESAEEALSALPGPAELR
jgi:predicted ribosome quality control (RQC) complex YloA/Tae2 family protein